MGEPYAHISLTSTGELVSGKTRPHLRAPGSGGDHRLPNHLSKETSYYRRTGEKGQQEPKTAGPRRHSGVGRR